MTKEITVYSKNNCMRCKMLKNTLTRDGLTFKEINLDEQPEHIDFVKDGLGYTQLPVLTFGEFNFSGFAPDKIHELEKLVSEG